MNNTYVDNSLKQLMYELPELRTDYNVALNAMVTKEPEQIYPMIDYLIQVGIANNTNITAYFCADRISKLMQATIVEKSREISDRYLGQELDLLGLDFFENKGKSINSKIQRMMHTLACVQAFHRQYKFDERFYCPPDGKKHLKIAKLVREIYEYLRDGGDLDKVAWKTHTKRRAFIKEMMAYYEEHDKKYEVNNG